MTAQPGIPPAILVVVSRAKVTSAAHVVVSFITSTTAPSYRIDIPPIRVVTILGGSPLARLGQTNAGSACLIQL